MRAYAELLILLDGPGRGGKTPTAETKALRQRLDTLLEQRGEIVADRKQKIDANTDPLQMLLYRHQSWRAQHLPPAETKPAKGAEHFPGAIPVNAPRVVREFDIDTTTGGWHSLGLYAAPGETVTVEIPEAAIQAGLAVQVGCHKDRLGPQLVRIGADGKPDKKKEGEPVTLKALQEGIEIADRRTLRRWSEATRRFELISASTPVANALGGLLYLDVPRKTLGEAKVKLRIKGAVEAPYFLLGRDRDADWTARIRQAPAPYAELAADNLVLTVPSAVIRDLEHPEALMEWWQQAMKLENQLSGRPHRPVPERIVDDIQISAGGGHSGYPIMAGSWARGMVDLAGLKKQGNWGCLHEMGHNENARNDYLSLPGSGEVVCNVYGCYVINTLCQVPIPEIRAKSWQSAERLLADGQGKVWERADLFERLMFYLRMADAFGWEPFLKVSGQERAGRAKQAGEKPEDWLLVQLSQATGHNLAAYFAAWGWDPSPEARRETAALPAWPAPFRKEGLEAKL